MTDYPLLDAISYAVNKAAPARALDLDWCALQAVAAEVEAVARCCRSLAVEGLPAARLADAVAQFAGKVQEVVAFFLGARLQMMAETEADDGRR